MSTTRYFTHVDKFCDGTAYIEVGDFGTRIVSASGAREDSTWTLDECMGNCREGVWRELSEADVIVLNIPSAPVDPRDATIATLQRENEALRKKLSAEEEDHAQLQARCYEGFASASDGIFDAFAGLRAEIATLQAQAAQLRAALEKAIPFIGYGGYVPEIVKMDVLKALADYVELRSLDTKAGG